jgi:hypothetical protein
MLSFITEMSIEGTTLEVLDMTPVASNYSTNIWFGGYTQGFETRYFTEEGHMVIYANFHTNRLNNSTSLLTSFENVETTFLLDDNAVFEEANEKASLALEKVLDTPNGDIYDRFDSNLLFVGFLNFETETFEQTFIGYGIYASNHSGGTQKYTNFYSHPHIFTTDSGDMFIIENQLLESWEGNQRNNDWSNLNPNFMKDAISTLSRYDLETGEKTILLQHENDGTIISSVYEKRDGFYITGSYYETLSNDVESVDAFLRATNESFVTQQELILSGSKDDVGHGIVLNASGQPVWIVMSNSNDGDFEGLDSTDDDFKFYYVSF